MCPRLEELVTPRWYVNDVIHDYGFTPRKMLHGVHREFAKRDTDVIAGQTSSLTGIVLDVKMF